MLFIYARSVNAVTSAILFLCVHLVMCGVFYNGFMMMLTCACGACALSKY